jgi:hypothetical protein
MLDAAMLCTMSPPSQFIYPDTPKDMQLQRRQTLTKTVEAAGKVTSDGEGNFSQLIILQTARCVWPVKYRASAAVAAALQVSMQLGRGLWQPHT